MQVKTSINEVTCAIDKTHCSNIFIPTQSKDDV